VGVRRRRVSQILKGQFAMHVTVIVPISTEGLRNDGELRSLCRNGLTVSGVSLASGPPSIESRVDEAFAIPGMLAAAAQAEKDGAEALVIDCMGDPGLGALREAVDIPVLGVAQTSMAICSSLAHSFGIVTVLSRIAPMLNDRVTLYGHESRYAGCRWVDVPVLDIHKRMDEVQQGLATHALQLVRDGAEAIILGCTGFMGCAEAIRKQLRAEGFVVPVVDPMPTTVSFAAGLVQHGLSHSQLSFPKREVKLYKGYDFLSRR
jgi:allantoin racemase